MRITLLGKGGSGKTTIATLLTNYVKKKYDNVLAIDADLNDHFGEYIGFTQKAPALGADFFAIADYLFAKRTIDTLPKIGTIPPTHNSRFIRVSPEDEFIQKYALKKDNLLYLNVGGYESEEMGNACFHGKLNALELAMHYLLDNDDDCLVIDAVAGTDILATSMYFLSDVYMFVVEPTKQSVSVYNDHLKTLGSKISDYNINIVPVFNKITNDKDLEFLRNEIEGTSQHKEIIFGFNPTFRKFEQGHTHLLDQLTKESNDALEKILSYAQTCKRNDDTYLKNLHATYTDECQKWVNDAYKKNMEELIDTSFSYKDVR